MEKLLREVKYCKTIMLGINLTEGKRFSFLGNVLGIDACGVERIDEFMSCLNGQ
jgi:hypothetical protein